MAIGVGEIAIGFGFAQGRGNPEAASIGYVGVCGKCGSLVPQGFEALHTGWHGNGAWAQQSGMILRVARGPRDPNQP